MKEELLEKNIFMMCSALTSSALSTLPPGFHFRKCQRTELEIWKKMHFDNEADAQQYKPYMDQFYEDTYERRAQDFFDRVLFVCNESNQPIATCFWWKAYQEFTTIHWFKVNKSYEGLGIGRALFSEIMKSIPIEDYPVYLHTQTGSNRAIKLYADFGFCLLTDEYVGKRKNDLAEGIPILKELMPAKHFVALQQCKAPKYFLEKLKTFDTFEF